MAGGAAGRGDDAFDRSSLDRSAWLPTPQHDTMGPADTNLAEHVATRIEKLAARSKPGTRLGSKAELRGLAGVSVGTINEALRIAQVRGGITLRRGPGGGIFAAPTSSLTRMGSSLIAMEIDEHSIADALRMRDALDPLVLADAVANVSDRDIAELTSMNAALRDGLHATDIDEYIHRHWAFQARVASISPNSLLRTVFVTLLGVLDEHAVAVFPPGTDLGREIEIRLSTHERMVGALRTRDLNAVLALKDDYVASQPEFIRVPNRQLR